jgi:carnitine O-acetyltransferase
MILCLESHLLHSFHSSRYPVKPQDTAHKFDPQTHNHVVFIRKNKFFQVPLASPNGVELSAAELEVSVSHLELRASQ